MIRSETMDYPVVVKIYFEVNRSHNKIARSSQINDRCLLDRRIKHFFYNFNINEIVSKGKFSKFLIA